MQKNVILLVVDSVFYNKILGDKTRNCPMPYFNELCKKGLYTTKMYSEAPYTEAALISILGGVDTLKNGSYIKRLSGKKSIMEVFKENGYKTFFNGYQPIIYPSGAYPGLTDKYYNICYNFEACWSYRLSFYQDLFKKNELSKNYYPLIIEILEDNFKAWIECFENIKNKDESMNFIIHLINADDIETRLSKVKSEYKKFSNDKEKYIIDLFEKGTNHELFSIKSYELKRGNSINFRKKLYNQKLEIFKKIYWLNAKNNFFNNRLIIKNPFKNKNEFIQYIKMYKACIFDKDLFEKIDYNVNSLKASPCMYNYLNHFLEWQKNNDKHPFFAYMHFAECHYPEIFYSHDIEDEKVLEKEFNNIEKFIDNIPKNYKGSLAYDLSLLYTDYYIKYLFEELEKRKLLDNTIVAICADHGSSYTFDPMHESYVRNQYEENYHIPFVLVGKDIKPKKIDKFCNSKDIPATIIDSVGIKVPNEYDGKSLLKYNGNDYVILQNINGGCPDYNKRKVWLGIRNKNYSITMEFDMFKEFKNGVIYSIFDLNKDKYEKSNLKNEKNIELKIEKELKILKKHFKELKENIKQNNFINK